MGNSLQLIDAIIKTPSMVEPTDPGNDSARLWGELNGLLCYHQKKSDTTPIHALNRLFREYYSDQKGLPFVDEHNATIRKEQWPTSKLDKVKRGDHTKIGAKGARCPVVIVEWRGERHLIDGRRRINQWVRDNNTDLHCVLVVTVGKCNGP